MYRKNGVLADFMRIKCHQYFGDLISILFGLKQYAFIMLDKGYNLNVISATPIY